MKFDTLRIRIAIVAVLGVLVCGLAAGWAWHYHKRTSEPLAGPLRLGEYMPLLPLTAMAFAVVWLALNVRRQWSRPSDRQPRVRLSTGYAPLPAVMSHDVDQWLADPAVGADWQDMDSLLAEVQLLPRLKRYLADPSAPQFKKVEVISALLLLLECDCPRDGSAESQRLAEELRATIRQHAEACEAALPQLGPVGEVVVRSILGLPIPADYPQWIIDRAREAGA